MSQRTVTTDDQVSTGYRLAVLHYMLHDLGFDPARAEMLIALYSDRVNRCYRNGFSAGFAAQDIQHEERRRQWHEENV